MKFIFYGGNHPLMINKRLHKMSWKDNPSLAYIPSNSHIPKAQMYFENFKNIMKDAGINNITYYPIDIKNSQIENLRRYDIIYLSWWDTYYFLEQIYLSWLITYLKDSSNNQIIASCSAWSIILTSNILIDIDSPKREIPTIWVNIVPFYIFPHYDKSINQRNFLKEYSKEHSWIVYALHNDDAIIITNDKLTLLGDIDQYISWKNIIYE